MQHSSEAPCKSFGSGAAGRACVRARARARGRVRVDVPSQMAWQTLVLVFERVGHIPLFESGKLEMEGDGTVGD